MVAHQVFPTLSSVFCGNFPPSAYGQCRAPHSGLNSAFGTKMGGYTLQGGVFITPGDWDWWMWTWLYVLEHYQELFFR